MLSVVVVVLLTLCDAALAIAGDFRGRRRNTKRAQTHNLQKTKVRAYVLTKAKTSAATARLALLIVVSVPATGDLPPDFGAAGVEAFYNRERILGSCTTTPLPPELSDATKRCRLLPGWVAAVNTTRDGCGSQCAESDWLSLSESHRPNVNSRTPSEAQPSPWPRRRQRGCRRPSRG